MSEGKHNNDSSLVKFSYICLILAQYTFSIVPFKSTTKPTRSMRYLPSFLTTAINEEFDHILTSTTAKHMKTFKLMHSVLTMPDKHFIFLLFQIGLIIQATTKWASAKIFNFSWKTSKSTISSRGLEDDKERALVPRLPARILPRFTAPWWLNEYW